MGGVGEGGLEGVAAGAAGAGFGDEDEAAGGDDVDPAAGAGDLVECGESAGCHEKVSAEGGGVLLAKPFQVSRFFCASHSFSSLIPSPFSTALT